jgi:hypothetical protein
MLLLFIPVFEASSSVPHPLPYPDILSLKTLNNATTTTYRKGKYQQNRRIGGIGTALFRRFHYDENREFSTGK